MGETLFISDLHLDSTRPDIVDLFQSFVEGIEPDLCDGLYILGDLFELWVGDDQTDAVSETVIAVLRTCSQGGTPVFLLHGNRDFLIGDQFARASGCRILDDPVVVTVQGKKTLLTHGDILCTNDIEYQAFRTLVRDPAWQNNFLSRPIDDRRTIAAHIRNLSLEQVRLKPPHIMDVNGNAVSEMLHRHAVVNMIHGHTHRPAIHEFMIDGTTAKRYVLGDWYSGGNVLHCGPHQWWLETLEL
jgi:UDP-2,3-diacylglucosamine hydrolase